jgi:outer membrane protein assembly factor BamB
LGSFGDTQQTTIRSPWKFLDGIQYCKLKLFPNLIIHLIDNKKLAMKRIFLTSLMLGASFLLAFSQDIAQWRGDNRDGIYNEKGLLKTWPAEGPKLLWHFDELGDGHSSAAVTSTMVVTAGTIMDTAKVGHGFVFALDLSGKLLWKSEYGVEWTQNWNGTRSTPLVYKDKIYLMSGFGKLVCMNAKDGKIIWSVDLAKDYDSRNITWGVTENLLIDDNKLFCTPGGAEANVIALDKNTGKLLWKNKGLGGKSAYASPMVINIAKKKILVTMTEGGILGIDASTGNLLWSHPYKAARNSVFPNTPIFKDGMLYVTSGYGTGGVMIKLSADGTSVTEVWKNAAPDPQMGGAVLLNNRIYATGHNNKKFYCLDWATGKEVFSSNSIKSARDTSAKGVAMHPANIISAEGLLYCYTEGGIVGLVEPKTDSFNLLGSFKVPFGKNQHWAHLVINNKKLYVRHGTSLMVYDIDAK